MTGWDWLMVFAYGLCCAAVGDRTGARRGYLRGRAEAEEAATAKRLKAWQARHAAERRAEDDDF